MRQHPITRRALAAGAASLAAPAIAQPRTRIEVWSQIGPGLDNSRTRAMTEVLDSFRRRHPDIDVNITTMAWDQLSPTLLRAARANQAPDVAMLLSANMPTHIAARTLMPLEPYLGRLAAANRADIVSLSSARNRAGETFGLPFEIRVSGFAYRHDLVTAGGRALPRSLDELSAAMGALATGDMVGLGMGWNPAQSINSSVWFLSVLLGEQVRVLNEDGTAGFATPAAARVVQWVLDQTRRDGVYPLSVAMGGLEAAQQLFIAGKVLFLPTATARLDLIRERSQLGPQVRMMPYLTFTPDRPAPAMITSWNLVMPRGTRNGAAAWRFIEHWTSRDVQVEQARIAAYIPVRTSALTDPLFQRPESDAIRWAVEHAAANPMQFEFPENIDLLYDVWARMFGQVLNARLAPAEGLERAAAEYNQAIRRGPGGAR